MVFLLFCSMEDSPNYDGIPPPAGERADRWRRRSMSWGTESSSSSHSSLGNRSVEMVYEYHPSFPSNDESKHDKVTSMWTASNTGCIAYSAESLWWYSGMIGMLLGVHLERPSIEWSNKWSWIPEVDLRCVLFLLTRESVYSGGKIRKRFWNNA